MTLIPESIATRKTTALDETWESRLALLRYSQLKIDFQNETSTEKLQMWLEMFGGTIDETVVSTFTLDEYRRLLQSIILLFKLSGTVRSVELLGYVLGATSVTVSFLFSVKYDGKILYDGSYSYDSGAGFKKYCVSVEVDGVDDISAFRQKLQMLFEIFEPAWINLYELTSTTQTTEDTFPLTLPFTLY